MYIKDVFRLYADGNSACEVAKIMKDNNRYLRDRNNYLINEFLKLLD